MDWKYLIWYTPYGCVCFLLLCLVTYLILGCVSETDQRQHWQDCGAVMHEVCREKENNSERRDCEYDFYKECVDGS